MCQVEGLTVTPVPSHLPQKQMAAGGLARHTAASAEVLGSKVWRKEMLGETAWEVVHLCRVLLFLSLLGSGAERTVLLSVLTVSLGALPSQFLDLFKPGEHCGPAEG